MLAVPMRFCFLYEFEPWDLQYVFILSAVVYVGEC